MTLRKKDILKLKIFHDNLNNYLNDWKEKNFFYYADLSQKNLCYDLISAETIKEANEIIKELDKQEKQIIKDMLEAKELSFRANKNSQHYHVKF